MSATEAKMAVDYGADAIGLVGRMPSGPGIIPDPLIRQIASTVPPPVATFLLTSETDAGEIIRHHEQTLTSTIQLVDRVDAGIYDVIRQTLPAVKLVQVIHVLNERSVDHALEVSGSVDAILLDSGNPALKTKELGGTGRTHNWQISRKICEQVSRPVFLAGGITAANAREALEAVEPFGLDLCSGVRTEGILDERKLELFFRALTNY
jgi:phosphoribosylanthranilate isomerase